ncbi:MAG: serine/threonine-protein kinase [Candidatus Acidoferrales bacterium]
MERLGRYEILEELGRGAMGTVYRARDPKIDRIVALKTISITGASEAEEEEFRQRFYREAQAAGKLSHPGLVVIHDVGEDEATQTPYIVMEFIEGKTLEQLAKAGERLPPEKTLGLAKQVAAALDYAHSRQIIHRDIKPANIMVTEEGRAKITDFGIAKLAMTQLTQTGQILGTPAYMSPEQLSGGTVDGRSDLFSLGVILYWLLTGEKPFAGDTTTAVSFKIVYQEPIPPSQLNPTLSPEYDYIITRALAKDPNRRYQRGQELAGDLDDLLQGRPPKSRAAAGAAVEAAAEHTIIAQPRSSGAAAGPPPTATVKTPAVVPALEPAAGPPPPEKKRRWVAPAAAAVVLLLLLGGLGWWWASGSDSEKGEGDEAVQEAGTSGGEPLAQPSTPPRRSSGGATQTPSTPPPSSPRTSEPSPPQAEPRTRRVAQATLRLTGSHNFKRATLYVSVDERVVREIKLRAETKKRGGATVGYGRIRAEIPLSAGEHTITIRLKAPRDDFDETEYTNARFRAGQTRTLEITLGKLGSIVGFGGLTRDLTIRWVD